ncbi:hypothetical protein [Prolixibacter sp. NT017]|uniref:hypothetical protein n=1 Tax=Prolixibacter sp. NT017 TaxID=2652390 RepID=UPI001285EF83|nr:hypothetical protein [Prolixibacter sp. NT017]GET25899.1 hypothetical protein NT017_22280 [Prolixibacter sp. NT017]
MKTKKVILAIVAVLMMTGLTFAGETGLSMAEKNLTSDIQKNFQREIGQLQNYFYEHNINSLKENVTISFYVNSDRTLRLLQVITDNKEAKDFVKYMFSKQEVKADRALAGEAYTFNLYLRYTTP